MLDPFLMYLDPGTGATLMQLALAGTAGIAGIAKLRMNKFKRKASSEDTSEEETAAAEDLVEEPTTSE